MARMSQKERIARLQAEKAAAADEKAVKKAAKKAAKKTTSKTATKRARKSTSKSSGRMRAQWTVCDRATRPVKVFPFREKDEAYAECARLQESSGSGHFVRMERVPMEDVDDVHSGAEDDE